MALGIPFLICSWFIDCYIFLINIYRDDIMSYDQGNSRDFVMSEQQFEELEAFCKTEMKKMVF